MAAREKFQEEITKIPQEKLVYLDKSGIEDNACPLYGWSLRGERCYGKKVSQHTRRVSIVAGLCQGQIIAPVVFEGTCNKTFFETYVETMLIKELQAGQVVVMDNINFHKTAKVKALIESVGCKIKCQLIHIIETINDQLKNLFHIDHTRHRSVMNFQTNVLAGLLAYVFKPNKISVAFRKLNNLIIPLIPFPYYK